MRPRRSLRLPFLRFATLAFLAAVPVFVRAQYAPQAPPPSEDYGQYAPDEPGYAQQPGYTQPGQQAYSPEDDPNNGGQPYAAQQYGDPQNDPYNAPPAAAPMQNQAPLNTEQLEQLVAPIALYPDSLVAQILAAATYPAQVIDADHWRHSVGNAPPEQVVAGANAQSWDPSVKSLTAMPQLLAQMGQNIRWTIALGNAYYNQPQDVLDVIQVMRQRAQAAGNLQTGPQEEVTADQGYIQVAPADPNLMYLPVYNPWTAYGEPIAPYRGFSFVGALGDFFSSGFGTAAIRWGGGIAMGAFMHSPFGLMSWGLDWLAHTLLFHNSGYYSHSASLVDWGLPHGGPRVPYYRGIYNRPGYHAPGYGRSGYRGPVFHGGIHPEGPDGYRSPGYGTHPGYGFNTAREQANARQGFSGRSADPRFGYNSPQRGFNNNQQAWNHLPENGARPSFGSRPQQFTHPEQGFRQSPRQNFAQRSPAYAGNGFSRGYQGGFEGRSNFGNQQAYRAPSQSFGRNGFSGERPGNYGGGYSNFGSAGRGFSGKSEKSGGSHFFGGGGGFKEPKAPKAPKMDHNFGGGGHFGSGGGGHFGGGHGGGGGHSSHGGGHHH
jgi:hypothetical protein